LPPLRERRGDVPLLAQLFLDSLNDKYSTQKQISPEAMQRLTNYSWPGNVRELKHAVHRAYIVATDDVVNAPEPLDEPDPSGIEGLCAGRSIADVERDLIMATLAHFNGDKKAAATSLGVSLKTLYNRLKDYGNDES
jgi:DNA-binding NtrC family response regulator